MLYPNWADKVVFSASGPQPQILIETESFKSVLVGLEPGQELPVHPAPVAVYHFLSGSGWMVVNGEQHTVTPGATVVAPAGAKRGIHADTRLVFIAARSGE